MRARHSLKRRELFSLIIVNVFILFLLWVRRGIVLVVSLFALNLFEARSLLSLLDEVREVLAHSIIIEEAFLNMLLRCDRGC